MGSAEYMLFMQVCSPDVFRSGTPVAAGAASIVCTVILGYQASSSVNKFHRYRPGTIPLTWELWAKLDLYGDTVGRLLAGEQKLDP